jgi:amino acid transporter
MDSPESQRLKRVLSLRDLLVYGMMIMQVIAPVPIFGLLEQRSNNHSVTTILIAMLVMAITAISYGRMAMLYPMAGSAYTYVGRALNPHLGFLADAGVDLLYFVDPIQDRITLEKARELLGGRITIVGGTNSISLASGDPQRIRDEVRRAIEILGPTNRFILHPIDAVFPDTPWSGVETMINAWKQCQGLE